MSTSSLTKILLELETQQDNDIPSHRSEEVTAAENAVRNAKADLRALLAHQKLTVEQLVIQIQSVQTQLELAAASAESDDVEAEKAKNELKLLNLRRALRFHAQPPTAALLVEMTRIQQLQRGLNIYRFLRIQRIISMMLRDLQAACQDTAFSGRAQADLQPSAKLMERCSMPEQQMVVFLYSALKEYGIEATLRSLPSQPGSDHGTGFIHPAMWTISLAKSFLEASQADPRLVAAFGDTAKSKWKVLDWTYGDIAPASDLGRSENS